MSFADAPELFCELDLPLPAHGRVHLTREAMGSYALLPLDLSEMRTPSSFTGASQNQSMAIGEQPYVNVVIADPSMALRLAEIGRPNRQFYVKDSWFTTVLPNVVNCVITFDTSVNDSQDGQFVALEKFIPTKARPALRPELRKGGGFTIVFAEALRNVVTDGVEQALADHQTAFGPEDDNNSDRRQYRAIGIGRDVAALFFEKDLPKLPEVSTMRIGEAI